ncbi:MAG: Clp protease ClpP [Oscillospiraceae bacterium]|nr:Clp protease ClpP [Oscillospiraceae bacterium]
MRVTLNGQVVPSDDQWIYDWFGVDAFSPGTVRKALADNPEGEDLELELNSPGGSVFAGFELYSLLREARCKTVAIVQSLAASAASTVMAACDEVRMSPVAQVMIHLPASWAAGNQNDMRHEARVLESITQSILNGYEAKCRGKASRDRLDRLIRAESWLTAQEAVELGLADEILFQEEPVSGQVLNAVGGGLRVLANSAASGRTAEELLVLYEQLVRSGAAPAEGHPVPPEEETRAREQSAGRPEEHHEPSGGAPEQIVQDWRRGARLTLERNRFMEE